MHGMGQIPPPHYQIIPYYNQHKVFSKTHLSIEATCRSIYPQLLAAFYLTADIKHQVISCWGCFLFVPAPIPLTVCRT